VKKIYLDHSATTPVDYRVLEAMNPFFSKAYGNASSLHKFGQEAKKGMEESREKVADVIKAERSEIIFTSGGTEADNLAIKGICFANKEKKKNHIITSKIEHHAILHTCQWMEKNGFEVTYLPVNKYGLVNPDDVEQAIKKNTCLVSIMFANNEIGTIEPIEKIGKICRENEVYFHTDAVQAFGKIPIDVNKMNIDLLSASAHKFYGPKGVGALFVRDTVDIEPILHGGGHENGMRSGTENVSGIVGFGATCEIAKKEMKKETERETMLRDKLIKGILKIENSHLNGHPTKRLPNNANFWFAFVEGESLILYLDVKGIATSTGSACSSKSLEPSHVLLAIGLKHEEAHGSLRLTLGKQNTKEEVDYVLEVLPDVVERLRQISPYKGGWNQ
jgi:cysteine desulfurase